MKEIRVSNRYAQSLLNLGVERNELENIQQDMDVIQGTLNDNRDLVLALKSPIIKSDTKSSILKSIFAGEVGETVMTFLNIMIQKGREDILFDVCKAFNRQYKALKNITTVTVTTAIAADEELQKIIRSFIDDNREKLEITGEIEINEIVNPDIMGGFIVQAGDLQIDQSVKKNFDDLRSEFSKNPYISEL